ncbi:COPII-coated vesicle protein SurF4/Erv29 [Aspergillus luchuensis]|uniref:COPII-coated vesicle protein SurF4/Erv29 n=1 Tax=Aspergillus kawachii TaxID=1069201 RepID=A0A146FTS2_ASPKA|nr:COPII-coated vesicle protein SurF4/Erv29 [Aspergillus luchuensis]
MAQIRGTAGYNFGHQNPFGGPGRVEATSDPSPLDAVREQTSKIEDWLDTMSDPVKPYLPAIGRFLIVVTFIEDSLRMITQWNDQLLYLRDYRKSKHGFWPRPSYIRSHPPWGRIADRL